MTLLDLGDGPLRTVELAPGAVLLGGLAAAKETQLLQRIAEIAAVAPFRHMSTPGGRSMSVAMTNAGALGWVSDGSGYRYSRDDPTTGSLWHPMPALFLDLATSAASAAGFDGFRPDACLINRYAPGARLTLHQDKNEASLEHPIVSVSLGLPAIFLWGTQTRTDRPKRIPLLHGDVVVWGGSSRLSFHGVDPLPDGFHPLAGCFRYNLTLRVAA